MRSSAENTSSARLSQGRLGLGGGSAGRGVVVVEATMATAESESDVVASLLSAVVDKPRASCSGFSVVATFVLPDARRPPFGVRGVEAVLPFVTESAKY